MNYKIDYSIVSRGTEKSGSKGYMGITEIVDNNRKLVLADHNELNSSNLKDSLDCGNNSINNIIFSRLELIPALVLDRIKIQDKILICGLGNIGITTLIYLLDQGYKDITIYVRSIHEYLNIDLINKKYKVVIKINTILNTEYFNTIIDTTGSSNVLSNIFNNIGFMKMIVLIGTPREGNYLIDPLIIHRNNLIVIGGHELRGVPFDLRQKTYTKLLDINKNNELLETFITIHKYSDNIVSNILEHKLNYIEVISNDD